MAESGLGLGHTTYRQQVEAGMRYIRDRYIERYGHPWRHERVLTITADAIADVLGGDVQEMRGDPIVRERVKLLLARDCARRKFMAVLLPALDPMGRQLLREEAEAWEDAEARQAGLEILDHAEAVVLRA